jgi:hypothetical protein
MKPFFTCCICSLLLHTSFAQAPKKKPVAATEKVTVVTVVTDAKGRTHEVTSVKTGKAAQQYLAEHPEIRNTPPNEWVTKRVTVIKRTRDPLTGRLREERIVKEGAEAEEFDWRAAGIGEAAISKVKTGLRMQTDKHPMPHTSINNGAVTANNEDNEFVVEDSSEAENKAYLGVSASEMPSAKGVVIDFILAGSPAAKAGLAEWDIIQKVNDIPVHNAQELQKALEPYEPNDHIKVDFWRGDTSQIATVTMESSDNLNSTADFVAARPVAVAEKPIEKMAMPIAAEKPIVKATVAATPAPIVAEKTNEKTVVEKNLTAAPTATTVISLKDFKLYPRPSKTGMFTVQFVLDKTDYVLLRVIAPNGKGDLLVREIKQFKGEYVYQIDVQKLSRGNYTLVLYHNGVEYRETLPYE